ncbi:unnamed protein product [Parnassius apollo]|uniref:(apollo) hypothetical protein n=1 Tax=Parnassius apollo TaxID=110799 RepID=A0A8S3X633_PARAO|nr:unnamed protein product [Parnassius apollo]
MGDYSIIICINQKWNIDSNIPINAVCCATSGAIFPAVAFPFDEGTPNSNDYDVSSLRSGQFGVTKYVGAQNVPNTVCQVLLSDGYFDGYLLSDGFSSANKRCVRAQ